MPVSQLIDHVEAGLSLLIEQYQEKPRLAALLTSYLQRIQEIEDANWDVLVSRLIDTATGEQLTVLTRLVGESVRLADDERQRVLVRARIATNRSHGHVDDIITVAALLLGEVPFALTEFYPGALVLTVSEAIDFTPELEQGMLEDAAPAGVRIDVHYSADDPEDWFLFGSGPGWGEGLWISAVSDHATS